MSKPNLLFPTPIWTTQLENFKSINEEMYNYIKKSQINDKTGIKKVIIKVGILKILICKKQNLKTL